MEKEPQKVDESPNDNAYFDKYAGTYKIMVEGYQGTAKESYVLSKNGEATRKNQLRQGVHTEVKFKKWTASEGIITITMQGKNGAIPETFNLIDGQFVNDLSSDRYLVKK